MYSKVKRFRLCVSLSFYYALICITIICLFFYFFIIDTNAWRQVQISKEICVGNDTHSANKQTKKSLRVDKHLLSSFLE